MQIADALSHAHEHGVTHRDLKSTNVVVTPQGRVKVLDFGLAARLRDTELQEAVSSKVPLTESRMIVGTLPYLAPELLRGEPAGERTDIWALGVLLYEMASAAHPFRGRTAFELSSAILRDAPTPLPAIVPSELGAVILRCLEKSQGDRCQSAAQVRDGLQELERDPESGSHPAAGAVVMPEPPPVGIGKLWKIAVPVLLVALLIGGGGLYYHAFKNKRLTDKDTVVVADFSNSTGDAVFDDTLKMALNASLRQSPFLSVLSSDQVTGTLQMMTRPLDTKLTPEVARQLCQRAGSKAYVAGAIGSLGSEYVIGLKAVNCLSGNTLAEEEARAASKDKVLNAVDEVASKLRVELGESLGTVQKFDLPPGDASTSSIEALQAYALGIKADSQGDTAAALPHYQRAVELDPDFAMGYMSIGDEYANLSQPGRASEYYTKAFQLREHSAGRERLTIISNYYESVTGELGKAAQAYEKEIANYPQDFAAYGNVSAVYAELGQYEKAAEATRHSARIMPDQPGPYLNLADYILALQHFDEARQMIHEVQSRKMDHAIFHSALYALAFLGADPAAMAEQQQWLTGKPEYENLGLGLASETAAYGGHLGMARELTKRAGDSAIRVDSKERAALWDALAAQREAAFGNTAKARQAAADALTLAPASQGVQSEAALALAMAGDTARAGSMAQDLAKLSLLNTQMQSIWLPAIQGQLALERKNPALAIKTLQTPSDVELGQIDFVSNVSCLYSVYVRAQASLAAGQANAAAAEFQKILDHSGIVWNCWTGALAHLGVARANALQSRTSQGADADAARVRALAAYKDFLTLWKDADPDIPILKEAKAEYAKLQ
jgi:tetratricopeptide (TPR) repeat protein